MMNPICVGDGDIPIMMEVSRYPELITHNVSLRGIIGGVIRRIEMEGT